MIHIHNTTAEVVEAKLQKLLDTLSRPTTPEQQKAALTWLPTPKKK